MTALCLHGMLKPATRDLKALRLSWECRGRQNIFHTRHPRSILLCDWLRECHVPEHCSPIGQRWAVSRSQAQCLQKKKEIDSLQVNLFSSLCSIINDQYIYQIKICFEIYFLWILHTTTDTSVFYSDDVMTLWHARRSSICSLLLTLWPWCLLPCVLCRSSGLSLVSLITSTLSQQSFTTNTAQLITLILPLTHAILSFHSLVSAFKSACLLLQSAVCVRLRVLTRPVSTLSSENLNWLVLTLGLCLLVMGGVTQG